MLRSLVLDFNAYFASVEQEHRPELRGRPVVIAPVMTNSTCCIAASYEAKAFGIKTGTGIGEALRLCPGLAIVEARHWLYISVHKQALSVIETIAPIRQVMSIDEMEIELTGSWRVRDRAVGIARALKEALIRELGQCMRTSVGIAPNTLLAKLASNMQKPDGLTVLDIEELPHAIAHLPPKALNGIGPRMWQRLQMAGLTTMEKLYAAPKDVLHTVWGGSAGDDLYERLRGQWQPLRHAPKRSISHSHVLPPAQRTPQGAFDVLNKLVQKAAVRMRKDRLCAGAMTVSLSRTQVRTAHMHPTQDSALLLQALQTLWQQGLCQVAQPKSVSVVLHGLSPANSVTPPLFDDRDLLMNPGPQAQQALPARQSAVAMRDTPCRDRTRLMQALDHLNQRYGNKTVHFASTHAGLEHAPMRIAFHHVPDLDTEL